MTRIVVARIVAVMTQNGLMEHTLEKANVWINDVASELGSDDPKYGYRILRAYLHALRDRLTVDEAAQLAAQLPTLIRGIYYEGWVPARTPLKYHGPKEFLDRIAGEAMLAGDTEASFAATAVARVLRRHISEGEIDDVVAILPADLKLLVTA